MYIFYYALINIGGHVLCLTHSVLVFYIVKTWLLGQIYIIVMLFGKKVF